MIFVDTSGIFALLDRGDPHHAHAKTVIQEIVEADVPLITHNYVLLETVSLAHRRMGRRVAAAVEGIAVDLDVDWIDAGRHAEAMRLWSARTGTLSLVDQVSFLVMRERGIDTAFAFDTHFGREGFKTL